MKPHTGEKIHLLAAMVGQNGGYWHRAAEQPRGAQSRQRFLDFPDDNFCFSSPEKLRTSASAS